MRVCVVDVCGGGLVIQVTFVIVYINDEDEGDSEDDGEGDECGGRLDAHINELMNKIANRYYLVLPQLDLPRGQRHRRNP